MEVYTETIENEIALSKVPVLVEFFAKWCRPCEVMEPTIRDVATQMKGSAKVLTLNIEKNRKLSSELNVLNLPTFLVYKNGKMIMRLSGVQEKEVLVKLLREA